MSSSNSFNICPRCGNSNSLNAKYCSRCGAQLKVPTEAVVCHKCHTRNSSLANFCRNCGATLKVGAQTKICPRCGREIGAEENMCACGYSFVTLQQTEPKRADVSSTNQERKKDKKRRHEERAPQQTYAAPANNPASQEQGGKQTKKKKGGRGFAFFALLFLAVFVVFAILPASARGPLVNFDKGIFQPKQQEESEPNAFVYESSTLLDDGDGEGETPETPVTGETGEEPPATGENTGDNNGETGDTPSTGDEGGEEPTTTGTIEHNIYGWDLITKIIDVFGEETKTAMGEYEGGALKYLMNEYFGAATFIVVVMFALFLLTAVFHLIVCVARLISPKRSKHANLLYLVLAVITTILVALMFISQMNSVPAGNFKNFFAPTYDGLSCAYGYTVAVIPVYYWFFWLYSAIAKKKSPKKDKKAKKDA